MKLKSKTSLEIERRRPFKICFLHKWNTRWTVLLW